MAAFILCHIALLSMLYPYLAVISYT